MKALIWLLPYCVFLLAAGSPVTKEPKESRGVQLDRVISKAFDQGQFAGNVLIAEKGQVIFSKSYGLANREHNVPLTLDTKFRIGSITKQFTASAIMLLEQRGLLKVNDTVRKYIPDYPEIGNKITIEQLLSHTSGIPNYTDRKDFDWKRKRNLEEMVNLFKNEPLQFEPGTDWSYSNSGYLVLGRIIEKISGRSYGDFIDENLFKPAHMYQTLLDRSEQIIPDRAQGYDRFTGTVQNASYIEPSQVESAGAVLTSVHDLFLWDRVLRGTEILSERSKQEMFKARKNNFGFGWVCDQFHGHKRVHHGGAISGFVTEFARYLDTDATVIVFNNTISGEPNSDMADALAAILFGIKETAPST